MGDVLVYGSYGYTGALIAREALAAGLDVVLGGRDREKVRRQRRTLGTEGAGFSLDEPAAMRSALEPVEVLVNCAGPFAYTADPLIDGCLAAGTDYLDITGEPRVLRSIAGRDEAAKAASVTLLPGVAFDVVPTDCLAAYLHGRLPSATHLRLGFRVELPLWRFGGGSLATGIEHAASRDGGVIIGNTLVRRDGRLETRPPAWKSTTIDFGDVTQTALTIPWGDVVTAYHTTGIPNIDVCMGLSRTERALVKSVRYLRRLYAVDPVRRAAAKAIRRFNPGPSDAQRRRDRTAVWGRVTDERGAAAEARLRGPGTYEVSARAAVATARNVLEDAPPDGFQTPAGCYGPDLALEIDGMAREDVE